jgi:hypothetical protein
MQRRISLPLTLLVPRVRSLHCLLAASKIILLHATIGTVSRDSKFPLHIPGAANASACGAAARAAVAAI